MIATQISYISPTTDVHTEFPRWVAQYCNHNSVVLDVGAGTGITGHAAIIQQRVAHLVGIDPDADIEHNPYLHEYHCASIEEFAQRYNMHFNCLYARFVLEHVTYPLDFLSACRSLLQPGGMLFGVTPNLWHYFGIATKISASLGIEDWLLGRLIGTQARDSYHFPTAYRMNSVRILKCLLEQAGFQAVEFVCFDPPIGFEYCFPQRAALVSQCLFASGVFAENTTDYGYYHVQSYCLNHMYSHVHFVKSLSKMLS